MLNLDSIEYVATYNIWFCIRLIIIAIPICIGLEILIGRAVSPFAAYKVYKKDGFISGLILSFFVSLAIIFCFGKTNYAKVEIADKEKCIEVFGGNPQDRCSYIRSEGNKFYYYYVLDQFLEKQVFQNEDELKNSIEKKFESDLFQADIKNKTTVMKKTVN